MFSPEKKEKKSIHLYFYLIMFSAYFVNHFNVNVNIEEKKNRFIID